MFLVLRVVIHTMLASAVHSSTSCIGLGVCDNCCNSGEKSDVWGDITVIFFYDFFLSQLTFSNLYLELCFWCQGDGVETEVTWEDQQNINLFGRLNNKFHELEDEIKATKVQFSMIPN